MLRKSNRISTRMFPKTERPLKNLPSDSVTLSLYQSKENAQAGASVIVSKKVAKSAVMRNKIRRRFYSLIKKEITLLPKNSLLIFYVKKTALGKKYSELELEVENLIKKI